MMGERREAEHPVRGADVVGDLPVAVVVEIPVHRLDAPVLAGHAADEGPGEAEPGRVEAPEPLQPHHLAGRAKRRGLRGRPAHVGKHPLGE